jgi:hypothetical protein
LPSLSDIPVQPAGLILPDRWDILHAIRGTDGDMGGVVGFREWLGSWRDWFRGVLFGMAVYDAVMMFRKQRADMEHLFVLIVFGDLVGVPILPPFYTLRLLPYVIPEVNNWKRRMLREKDLTDLAGAG